MTCGDAAVTQASAAELKAGAGVATSRAHNSLEQRLLMC
jgi:hypothetical protein